MKKAEAKVIGLENCKLNDPIKFSIKVKGEVDGNATPRLWIITNDKPPRIYWTDGWLTLDGYDSLHYVDETHHFPKKWKGIKFDEKSGKEIKSYKENKLVLKEYGLYYLTGVIYDIPLFKTIYLEPPYV